MLEVSPVRAFSDNYLWLIRSPDDPSAAAIVDPGDARPANEALQSHGLEPRAIPVTRHHEADRVDPAEPGMHSSVDAVRELRQRDEPSLPTTIAHERRINPFLRCRERAVRDAAEAHAGRATSTPVEVFAVVLSWKDGFR